MNQVLIVDDELSMREFLEILLQKEKYEVETAAGGEEAIRKIESSVYDLIICDVMMPKVDGMAVLRRAREIAPECLVIMITAYASAENAVNAMKIGAYDYITKPFQIDEIKLVVRNALEKSRLVQENLRLRQEVEGKYTFENLVGNSPAMEQVFDLIRRIAPTKSNILVTGESGTGKELVAKAIHYNSKRAKMPMVTVNCGAIPSELLESELFGHLRGSFTGAYQDKRGLFAAGDQGTVFLDEIGEMPLATQVKLLRVIQERTFKPVGGIEDVHVDVRVIAASNRDLEQMVSDGRFREDLYYRLNVIQIRMPSLRERRDDIPLLVRHFLSRYSCEFGKEIKGISKEAERLLIGGEWPGNVRELENTIERAVSLATTEIIEADNLPDRVRSPLSGAPEIPAIAVPDQGMAMETVLQDIEKSLIEQAMQKSGGIKKKAAQLLGISFRSFRYRLEKLDLDKGGEDEDGED